jgi:predicted  nucleic acid-binding Zn-ribbon protein
MKEADDITILVEQHAKEIWSLKQELSKASEELIVLRGTKDVVVRLSNELVRMKKRAEEAEKNRPLDTMDEVAYRELQAENEKLKKRAQEAEGETSIVKGIGSNSPEMKELKARVKELDNSLAIALEINESHQRYNGKLQTRLTEVEEDNKKLSHQVEDKIGTLREKGLI